MKHILIDKGNEEMDGDQHTAELDDFINLHESPCGFGDTQIKAVEDLIAQIKALD